MAGNIVDVFFAALKKLVVLFGGLPEQTFVYAFVVGLPARVKQLLRVSTSMEAMLIKQLLEHVQAIIRDETELEGGTSHNSCADGPEWPYKFPPSPGWTHEPERIASIVDWSHR